MLNRNRVYTVHEKGASGDDIVFVREGFSVFALIFSAFWLAFHRVWIAAAVVFGLMVLVEVARISGDISFAYAGLLRGGLSLAVGLFGYDLQRAALERRGYLMRGVTTGGSLDEAELRYFWKRYGQDETPPPAAGEPHPA